jgi:uncharacterized membrane protein
MSSHPLLRPAGLTLLILFSLPIGLHALRYALDGMPGAAPLPNLRLQPGLLMLHAVSGGLSLLLGPWQFISGLRARRPGLHRGIGWAYVVAVGIGGISGLALAPQSMGGPVAHAGFGLLALALLGSTAMALRHAIAGRHTQHRRWMLRSFALTAAGISLRLQLGLATLAGVPVPEVYTAIAWSCWLPQVLLLEFLWLARRPQGLGGLTPSR